MTEEVCFRDTIHLGGKHNLFKYRDLFAAKPVLANLIVVQPHTDLELLSQKLENLEAANCPDLLLGNSVLPNNKGLLVRAFTVKLYK